MNKLMTLALAAAAAFAAASAQAVPAVPVATPAPVETSQCGVGNRCLPPDPRLIQANQLQLLNAAVVDVLKPFNNNLTKAEVVFKRVLTNATRAVAVDATLDYLKKGPDGDASVKIEKLSYDYPEGGQPKIDAKLSLGFNMLNVLTQEQINEMGPAADEIVSGFAKDYLKEYGAAATVDAKVTRRELDANNNLKAIAATLSLKVDLSQLPTAKAKDVMMKEMTIVLQATLTGAELAFSGVSNPDSSYFQRDQEGLKEHLDKLLARDPQELQEIRALVRLFDGFATSLTRKSRP